ncbi:MAG: hypothetical protein PHY56_00215 [Candidatus Omnitrophica bacterium]|nr:hypothetical protein [Candidatus Omnitrophota bacterium]
MSSSLEMLKERDNDYFDWGKVVNEKIDFKAHCSYKRFKCGRSDCKHYLTCFGVNSNNGKFDPDIFTSIRNVSSTDKKQDGLFIGVYCRNYQPQK